MHLKKYSGTIRVLLPEDRDHTDPLFSSVDPDLCGYYRSVSAYALTESDAVAILNSSVADGHIDWSNSELVEVEKDAKDWIRMLTGRRVMHESGRAFFPSEESDQGDDDEGPVGWRMGKSERN